MINQSLRGDGWRRERRRSSSVATSHLRRKISRRDEGGCTIDTTYVDHHEENDGEVPGAYAVTRDDLSLQNSESSQGSIIHENAGRSAECVPISTIRAMVTNDETELVTSVHIDESTSESAQKIWTTRHTKAIALVMTVVLAIVTCTVAAVVLLTRQQKPCETCVVAPPKDSDVCDSSVLDPFVQCQCTGEIKELNDDAYQIYQTLKNSTEFRYFLLDNINFTSCDAGNLSLVWLSLELGNGFLPTEPVNRFVLVLLYASMDGNQWMTQDGWLSDLSECNWHGIECDELKSIVSIVLPNNKVGGTLPTELGMLSKLQIINFMDNEIGGSIPNEIWALSTLTGLYLDRNHLVGRLPDSFKDYASASSLQHISLRSNAITGPIPNCSGLDNLQSLILRGTQVTGLLPLDGLVKLSKLEVLDLSWTAAVQGGHMLDTLALLTNLRILELGDNDVDGRIPESIGNLVSLERLKLNGCRLSGSIPTSIGYLTNLTGLYLQQNNLEGSISSYLGTISFLQHLDVSRNQALGGTIPSELSRCANLETFHVDETSVTGTLPVEFGNLTRFDELWIACSNIRGSESLTALCDAGATIETAAGQLNTKNCSCCRRRYCISHE